MSKVGFRDIADALRRSIEAGEIGPERALPSELELMDRYGVARTTVRRALSLLQDEALIEVVQGRGRFVRADAAGPGITRTDKKYEQVAEEIRKLIAAGTVPDGARLGTESELADRFDVSTGTARRALVMLAEEGLLSTVRGQAWFAGDLGEASDRTGALAASLRWAIVEGRFPAGSFLPGELALAEDCGVARVTVRRALAALESEGLIETRPGLGRYILAASTAGNPAD